MQPQRQLKPKHPRRIAKNHDITGSNQLWEVDIKYVYIEGEDRFCFLMSMIDVFDREIVDYHIGLSCKGTDAKKLLQRCLWRRQLFSYDIRPIVRTDNGPQFISDVFGDGCIEYKVQHERIPPKTPNMNAHIESFHAQLQREKLSRYALSTYQEAYQLLSEYIHFYNRDRIHGSLFDIPPVEFRLAIAAGEIIGKTMKL